MATMNHISGGPTDPIQAGKEVPPSQVSLGSSTGSSPYMPTNGAKTFGPETVRATGGGAGDAQWRQNLATFSGGQFQRPGGSLNFNPLSNNPFGGAPTGGGNSPQMGMPSTLLQMALGGQPFSFNTPSAPAPTPSNTGGLAPTNGTLANQPGVLSMNDFLSQYMSQGANLGMPSTQ